MDDNPDATAKLLIALAFFMSALLTLINGFKTWFNKHLRLEVGILVVSGTGCVLAGLSGLILFLANKLSLDAFGVVLIGLIPGLEAISGLRVAVLKAHVRMRKKTALHNELSKFCYLRHGRPLNDTQRQALGVDAACVTSTYLRVPASYSTTEMTNVRMWNGIVVKVDDKVIVLKDKNDIGDPVMWWKAANSAVDVVSSPSKARLSKPEQVARALEAVAEICMIGDSVLKYHGESLRKLAAESGKLKQAMFATPASVCSSFLSAIGLSGEWGPVDESTKELFTANFENLNRAKKYGMLFFMLLVESSLFDDVTEIGPDGRPLRTADRVIKAFEDTKEDSVRSFITQNWLSRYGLTGVRLARYNNDSEDGTRAAAPQVSYALIPLHANAAVPQDTQETRLDINQIWSAVQTGSSNPLSIVPLGSSPPQASTGLPSSVPAHVPQSFPNEVRVVMPITIADTSQQTPGTSGQQAAPAPHVRGQSNGPGPGSTSAPQQSATHTTPSSGSVSNRASNSHGASSSALSSVVVHQAGRQTTAVNVGIRGGGNSAAMSTVVPSSHDPVPLQATDATLHQGTVQ